VWCSQDPSKTPSRRRSCGPAAPATPSCAYHHPQVLRRTSQPGDYYEEPVGRIPDLAAEGHQDAEMARRLTKEGFRSARPPYVRRGPWWRRCAQCTGTALAYREPAFPREDRRVLPERARPRAPARHERELAGRKDSRRGDTRASSADHQAMAHRRRSGALFSRLGKLAAARRRR
jgi:arginyl-tRNA--protein-N-Asp/Glu arginylyltransferase